MHDRWGVGVVALVFMTACGGDDAGVETPPPDDSSVMEAAQALLEHEGFPGMAFATVTREGVSWTASLGDADPENDLPVTSDTAFWLASVTKPVTGLALLAAREDGALDLDTPIAELLQAKENFTLASPHAEDITIEHLVTHRSSILDADAYECAYFLGDELGEHTSLANELYGEPLCDDTAPADLGGFLESYLEADGVYFSTENFAPERPGERVEYSNVGAALAGFAIELATGASLADFASERFFEPLGLANTSFHLSDLDASTVAVPYTTHPETGERLRLPLYSLSTWPDGGLRSSANDLGKLVVTVMNHGAFGDVRLLEESSVETALEPRASLAEGVNLGVFWVSGVTHTLTTDGQPHDIVFHDGGDTGAFSYVVFDRDTRVGLLILANGDYAAGEASSDELLATLVQRLFALATEYADQRD